MDCWCKNVFNKVKVERAIEKEMCLKATEGEDSIFIIEEIGC